MTTLLDLSEDMDNTAWDDYLYKEYRTFKDKNKVYIAKNCDFYTF